jgi:hypothetical protein
MSWIQLTASDLLPLLVAEQLDALRTEALAPGQADPFTELAPAVIAKVRATIASNPANRVDADPATIPAELKLDTLHLILAALLARLGQPLTADQRRQLDATRATLTALREKKLLVSQPAAPVAPDVQSASAIELATSTARQATRATLRCL